MKKLIYIYIIFTYALLINAQPNIKWSKEFKSDGTGIGGSIYSDLKGNTYGISSYYGQTVELSPGYTYSATGYNKPTLVFGVDSSNGTPTWVSEIKPIAGCGCNYGARSNLTKTDNSGNLLVAGYFCNCGTMAFGTQTLSALSHQTFLAKYDKTGNLLWVKTKPDVNNGSSSADYYVDDITSDEFDNIYLCINTNLSSNFAGVMIPKGSNLIKMSPNGNIIWSQLTYNYNTPSQGIRLKKLQYISNRLYASAVFFGNFTFSGHNFSCTNAYVDEAILKIDTAGNLINKMIISSTEEDAEFDLKLLPNASLVYFGRTSPISGPTTASLTVGTNTYSTINDYDKYYFIKLDTSLNVMDYKNFIATNLNPYMLTNDLNNNLYLAASNSLVNNSIDAITITNTGPNIIKIDNNLNAIDAFKSASYYVCADKDANLYTTTSSTSVTINAFGTSFTPSGPYAYSQYQIKLGPLVTGIGNTGSRTSNAQIYPNPSANGIYNLKIGDIIKQKHNIQITLTNNLGQSFNNITYTIENNQTIQVNLANFANGLYNITAIIDG